MIRRAPTPPLTPYTTLFLSGDTAASLTSAPTCTTGASTTSNVGTYPSSCSGAVDANYTISYAAGSVTVGPAALTITAAGATMAHDGTAPATSHPFARFANCC